MKKFMIFAAMGLLLVSCGNNRKARQQAANAPTAAAVVISEAHEVGELLLNAEKFVDKKVTVRGYVTHTCKHSGKRCFIVGDDQKTTFRVEAKGNIGGFNRELTGSEIAITGILKERRLSREYLDRMEREVNEQKIAETGSVESCEAELANISDMKAWMKANGRDYYSTYYMDGEDYEIIEE